MAELREALLAYLVPEAEKAGSCLIASCINNMSNWNESVFFDYITCCSHCKDNGLQQDNYRLDRGCHLDIS